MSNLGLREYTHMIDILIPVYNEEKRIASALPVLLEYIRTSNIVNKVVFIDDHSTDTTPNILASYATTYPWIHTLKNTQGKGKGGAVKTGMLWSTAPFSAFCDVDFSVSLDEIERFLRILEKSVTDIAIASRYIDNASIEQQPLSRKMVSRAGKMIRHILLHNNVKDSQCGFKVFNKKSREIIFPLQQITGFGFDIEILTIAQVRGLRIQEIGIAWRHGEESHIRIVRDSFKVLFEILKIKMFFVSGRYGTRT